MKFLSASCFCALVLGAGSTSAEAPSESAAKPEGAERVADVERALSTPQASPYIKRSWVGTSEPWTPAGKMFFYPTQWEPPGKRRSFETTDGLPSPAKAVDGRALAASFALNLLLDASGLAGESSR